MENKKEVYVVPECEITYFETEDVIVCSGGIDQGDAGLGSSIVGQWLE